VIVEFLDPSLMALSASRITKGLRRWHALMAKARPTASARHISTVPNASNRRRGQYVCTYPENGRYRTNTAARLWWTGSHRPADALSGARLALAESQKIVHHRTHSFT
jgi:hypothetical protein